MIEKLGYKIFELCYFLYVIGIGFGFQTFISLTIIFMMFIFHNIAIARANFVSYSLFSSSIPTWLRTWPWTTGCSLILSSCSLSIFRWFHIHSSGCLALNLEILHISSSHIIALQLVWAFCSPQLGSSFISTKSIPIAQFKTQIPTWLSSNSLLMCPDYSSNFSYPPLSRTDLHFPS